jgi:hypothetical protein
MYSLQNKNDKQKQNKQTKYKAKKKKKNSRIVENKILLLLVETCQCCSKLFHLHKKVRMEYQQRRQSNKL